MDNAAELNRYRVFDRNDRFCGVWYAEDAVSAIRAAVAEHYDADHVDTAPYAWHYAYDE